VFVRKIFFEPFLDMFGKIFLSLPPHSPYGGPHRQYRNENYQCFLLITAVAYHLEESKCFAVTQKKTSDYIGKRSQAYFPDPLHL
jgi:hypothetical protein